MYQIIKENWGKSKYFVISGLLVAIALMFAVYFKNDEKILKKTETIETSNKFSETKLFIEFVLGQIKSPFINVNYVIKKGDTIQKILQKYKVSNTEIQTVINQFKKYSNPNNLLLGNKIDITVKKNIAKNSSTVMNFNVPITKSTTIEISKNSENQIISKKIITKLYKRKTLAGNTISKNLYSSAIEAKIEPNTIVEFARIFGFEIDFQRDIRKNDYFKILYEKYFDENGEFVKSGPVLYAHMSVNNREITLYKFGDDKTYS